MPRGVLQYDSLRTVLQYIEANKRFCLSQRIPAIHFPEKAVPLKIDYLRFTDLGVNINSTIYQLSLYRDFHQGEEVVDSFQKENDEDCGGLNDLDKFGFQVPINRTDLVPGEVVFGQVINENRNFEPNDRPSFPKSHQQNDERMRRYYEKHLEIYQIALMRRLEQGDPEREETPTRAFPWMIRLFTDDELLAMAGPVRQELTEEELEEKLAVFTRVPTWYLEMIITLLRYCLQPFDCRHNNRPLPFTPLIQLTIKRKDQVERIERYPYTMKLHEAMRKLSWLMFGGRTSVVHVHKFSFRLRNVVLRNPEGLKIRVRDLWLDENMNGRLEALSNIIDESSYPLEVLTIFNGEEEEVDPFAHPVLTSVPKLILEGFKPDDMTLLLNLRNEKVFFKYWEDFQTFTVDDLLLFVQNILAARSPVGVRRSFGVHGEDLIENFLNQVVVQFNEIRRDRTAGIPMGNYSYLKVFYKGVLTSVREDRPQITRWYVTMTVVEASLD
ncbi:hypothetical protein GCK72_007309 [Caenorhabditis remanei]|uniref:Uncharacterized protein n=1 Tax=Caenorhabditis remanei TaxID=31234 RepID=A0A6A5HH17_CAERE|nr:hypothetical protein GCK72_007309 [Caenorhabditis remanei]KAF1767350.1 hypothetical protein GCK72_007309 [Caenorhabditis remanei]